MRYRIKFFGVLVFGVATCFGMSAMGQAQEDNVIEIVNQDGEKVQSAAIQAEGKVQGGGKIGAKVGGGVSVQSGKDGKITITDAEGNQREIDMEGARSIIVNQSVETVTENGEQQTKRFGKAIIIGPDGKRHEIDLGDPGAGAINIPGFQGVIRAERKDSYMIGVHCEPVSEALRSQLELDSGMGLVVVKVSDDSPAAAAGLKKHDILMFADDRQLANVKDLTEVVQTAGKEKNKVSLTVIRSGKEIGIDVSPVERPESDMLPGMQVFGAFPNQGPGFNMKFRQMGPGVIFGGDVEKDFHKDMEERMEKMRKEVEELHKQMREQFQNDKQFNKKN